MIKTSMIAFDANRKLRLNAADNTVSLRKRNKIVVDTQNNIR